MPSAATYENKLLILAATPASSSQKSNDLQYTPLDRSWPTWPPTSPNSSRYEPHSTSGSSASASSRRKNMTPMECWQKEAVYQSPWNNIHSFSTPTYVGSQETSKRKPADKDWSIVKNSSSKRSSSG